MQEHDQNEREPSNSSQWVESTEEVGFKFKFSHLLWLVLLVAILVAGAYFRTLGMDWDDGEYLHPDERFMAFVVSAIHRNENNVSFFDTSQSTMNPDNVGYNWYVYGTLPLFANRIVSDYLNETGLDIKWLNQSATGWEMYLVGRYLSAIYDTITILLTFLIGLRLFKKLWPAVIAAGFYAFFALPIQLSHYFTVDIMANMFSMAAFYMAVLIMTRPHRDLKSESETPSLPQKPPLFTEWEGVLEYVFFGVFAGLALACKVSAAPIVLLLPAAGIVDIMRLSSGKERQQKIAILVRNLVIGGIAFFLFFRIGQPYAFTGPTFFHVIPNQDWINDLKGLSGQSKGLVDFPPALQWSRRPIWFGFQNLSLWGVGLPLAIVAWASYLWQTVELARGKWKNHLVMWSLTTIFFVWQSVNFTSSMRYYLQIYAPLALTAAWGGWHLISILKKKKPKLQWVPIVSLAIAFLGTLGYGYAFSRIYSRPATRVEASDWYFQNIPAPINVKFDTENGQMQQVFGFQAGEIIDSNDPTIIEFVAQQTAIITKVEFRHIRQEYVSEAEEILLGVTISTDPWGEDIVGQGELTGTFHWNDHHFGNAYDVLLVQPASLAAGETYYLHVEVVTEGVFIKLTDVAGLRLMTWEEGDQGLQILPEFTEQITEGAPRVYTFDPKWDGDITRIEIPHIVDLTGNDREKVLSVRLSEMNNLNRYVEAAVTNSFSAETDIRGEAYIFTFDPPLEVSTGRTLQLEFRVAGESGVTFFGTKQAGESSWDDAVPLRRSGYDPFGAYMGEYRSELNFEMYWDDNEDKRDRFLSILEQADLIMITSSRQWGTTTRVPERYPMTTMYYRELIGCPEDKEIFWCYAVAEPGMFTGNLGFELKEVFQSNPNIGSFEINDQFAEEAFKVYDHPKVLIFEKTERYDREQVRELFYAVDLTKVIHMIPADVPLRIMDTSSDSEKKLTLMLPEETWEHQQQVGTWSDLYNPRNLLNQSELIAMLGYYLFIAALGLLMYPISRIVFSGLQMKGYAVSRLFALLLVALLSWLLGSMGIDVTRGTIWLVVVFLLLVNILVFSTNREKLIAEFQQNWKKILLIETVALCFFLAFLLVRIGNPDLWHPYKGGEKPMDFSYLNAVLKSTTFPPYDPWFAGGYINYYYYGFVIVGMPIKALGIAPAVAYNLTLAMLFSLFALVAYAIGTTLYAVLFPRIENGKDRTFFGGIATAIMALVIGNFGTIQMIYEGLIRLGGGGAETGLFGNLTAFFQGIQAKLQGNLWPFYPGDWYWIPSRMIEGEPITEMPYFTFLYADLHAHMIAMPITLLAVAWCISLLQSKLRWDGKVNGWNIGVTLLSGAVIVGALRPTNTWDFPVFLVLATLTLGYVLFSSINFRIRKEHLLLKDRSATVLLHFLAITAFIITTILLYSPFSEWYGEGYTSIKLWEGSRTQLNEYFSHWGIMLSLIVVWFAMDTFHVLKTTPVSVLKKLRELQIFIAIGITLVLAIVIALAAVGVKIHWLAVPIALWAALLMVQKNIPDSKRFLYFLTGTGIFLTVVVETIVLEGDIGRMNTVFKFYLQAWNLLAIVAAMGLSAFVLSLPRRSYPSLKMSTGIVLGLFLFCGLLFPVLATRDKITDRMSTDAPHVLDGMAFMGTSEYNDQGTVYTLKEDAEAIRWMQENVEGTPVIVEGHVPEYRWGNRFTIYTGLPSIVGWNWHQRQQRTYLETEVVQDRVNQVNEFFSTTNIDDAKALLQQYTVQYIIVGQLEKANYSEDGLIKFSEYDGILWEKVFSNSGTTIYQVLDWE
jgi:YYY domain-containing protein